MASAPSQLPITSTRRPSRRHPVAKTLDQPQLAGHGLAMLGPLPLEVEGPISGGRGELSAVGKIVVDPLFPVGGVDVVGGGKGWEGCVRDEG